MTQAALHRAEYQDKLDTERRILMAELAEIQNRPEHEHHDIMTITGFMRTNKEIRDHIARNS